MQDTFTFSLHYIKSPNLCNAMTNAKVKGTKFEEEEVKL